MRSLTPSSSCLVIVACKEKPQLYPTLGKKNKNIFALFQILGFSTQKWRLLRIFLAMCYPCQIKLFLFGPNILLYLQILPVSEINEKFSPMYQSQNKAILCLNPRPSLTDVYNTDMQNLFPSFLLPITGFLLCKCVCHP